MSFYSLITKIFDSTHINESSRLPKIQRRMLDIYGAAGESKWSETSTYSKEENQVKFWLLNNGKAIHVPYIHIYIGEDEEYIRQHSGDGLPAVGLSDKEIDELIDESDRIYESGAVRVSGYIRSPIAAHKELDIDCRYKLTPEQVDWLVDFGAYHNFRSLVADGPFGWTEVPIKSIEHLRFALEGDPRDLLVGVDEATTNDIAYSRYLTREKWKDSFLRVFRKPLNKNLFNNLTGFDVIAFDKFINPKEGENIWTAIERRYGDEGVKVIKGLMQSESDELKKVININKTNEATTISSIAFLPSHVGMVKAWLKKLAKEKPDWGLEILEGDGDSDNEFTIEDRVKFSVPKKHWGDFLKVFDGRMNNDGKLNLQPVLDEADNGLETIDGFPLELGMTVEWYEQTKRGWFVRYGTIKNLDPSTKEVRIRLMSGLDVVKDVGELYVDAPKTRESMINEAINNNMKDLRKELKSEIFKLLTTDELGKASEAVDYWKNVFGVSSYRTNKDSVAIKIERDDKDAQKIYGEILRAYGDDKGNLEMIISYIQDHRPLNAFEAFKNRDYLYGSRVQSTYNGIGLSFEVTIDFMYDMTQSIYIDDESIIDAIIEDHESLVKKSGRLLYPVGSKFRLTFFDVIRQIIDDNT